MKKLYILTAIGICMAFAGCSEYSDPSDVNGTGESVTGVTTTVPDNNGTNGESDWTSVVNSTTTADVNVAPENTQTYIVYTDENGLVIGTVNENTPEEEKITQPEGVSGSYAVIVDENGVVIGTSNGSVSPDVSGSDNPQGSTPVDTTAPTGTTTAPDNGGNGNGNSDSSQTTTAFVEITPKTMYASVSATLKSSTTSDAISLGTITKGSAVNVIGESGGYYVVNYNGITAFVSKGCVTDTKPQTETTTTTTTKKSSTTTTTKKSSATTTTTKPSTTTKKTTTIGTTTKATTTVGTTTKATTTTKKTTTTAKTTTTTKKTTTTTTTKKATTTTTTTKKTTTTTTTTKKTTTTTTTTSSSSGVSLPYDATTNAFINEVVRLTNEFRAENGVAALELDLDLTVVAMVRAEEITDVFSHTRPDGTSCFTAFEEGGFILGENCGGRAENIAYGYKSAAAVVEAWKNSEGHRANMLNSKFNVIGIGFVNDGGVYYWTQEFAYLW